jgi:uncharacterized protein (DUF1501 family)
MLSRRSFLTTRFAKPATINSRLVAPNPQASDVLVVIFLRGGADGLNMVVPHGEAEYYAQRTSIAIATPGKEQGALDLDGFFGLHPALDGLKEIWDAKQLVCIHACGSPDPTHSHFDAMDYMELGTPGDKSLTTGWLGRHLAATAGGDDTPFRAVGFGALLQASLRGGAATAITDLNSFALQARAIELPKIKAAHGEVYQGSNWSGSSTPVADMGGRTLAALDVVAKINPKAYKPNDGAVYPQTPYGQSLQQIAMLIKADVCLQVACADIGDWDTHVNQGGAEGEMAANLKEFGDGLHAFYTDLGPQRDRVTIVTMSEFGRRVADNGGGTDHGHGNVMFVLGPNVQGGKVYGQWPGLHADQLYGPGDLAITTDFRDVLGELVTKRLGNADLEAVFPGYATFDFQGIVV